ELDVRVGAAHRASGLGGEPAVLVGGLVAHLPGAVHLVAETPRADGVRILVPVRDPAVGQRRGPGTEVAVLEQVDGGADASRPEVDRHDRVDVELAGPSAELVDADGVGFDRAPSQVEAARTLVERAD